MRTGNFPGEEEEDICDSASRNRSMKYIMTGCPVILSQPKISLPPIWTLYWSVYLTTVPTKQIYAFFFFSPFFLSFLPLNFMSITNYSSYIHTYIHTNVKPKPATQPSHEPQSPQSSHEPAPPPAPSPGPPPARPRSSRSNSARRPRRR